ncbi:MAG: hypothetical protein HC916_21325 [Coleofasciculaceae cyanobacterium SM2_1_6]|nr:hypothetical protein [Coleofasciculaceae cyanobacterium SM2_1_6]
MTEADYIEKYGSEKLGWKHVPFGQKALFIIGIILGALQWSLFSGNFWVILDFLFKK